MLEKEVKFRNGESEAHPYGGKVSDEPFPQALYELARSRGYESQFSLAKALGKKGNGVVSDWYRGINVPTAEEFGRILILFKPNDVELDSIVDPYGELLAKGRGNLGSLAGSESAVLIGQKLFKPGKRPFDEWVNKFCRKNTVSLRSLSLSLGVNDVRGILGLDSFSEILQNGPRNLNLSPEEIDIFADSIAQTLEKELLNNHKFRNGTSVAKIILAQKTIKCTTYNGAQVADILEISRERVRQLRDEYELPYLLTEEHIDLLRNRKSKPSGRKRKRIE